MSAQGFGRVPDKGFSAFGKDLEQGAWGEIALKKFDASTDTLPDTALDAPQPVAWKMRLQWAIARLVVATGADGKVVDLDQEWDRVQRKLHLQLALHENEKDDVVRAAATRLRTALLSGNGTAQTQLDYDAEVDWGRSQSRHARSEVGALDVKRLGLESLLREVEHTTEALARGIGRNPGDKRHVARNERIRQALSPCVGAFNAVYDDLAFLRSQLAAGEARVRVDALLEPLDALLARYPGAAAAAAAAAGSGGETSGGAAHAGPAASTPGGGATG